MNWIVWLCLLQLYWGCVNAQPIRESNQKEVGKYRLEWPDMAKSVGELAVLCLVGFRLEAEHSLVLGANLFWKGCAD